MIDRTGSVNSSTASSSRSSSGGGDSQQQQQGSQSGQTRRVHHALKYRTCCGCCHIAAGTVALGLVELCAAAFILANVVQQLAWKQGGAGHCTHALWRDCLIFNFRHFSLTLIVDYLLALFVLLIMLSVLLMFIAIARVSPALMMPHIFIQAVFLIFSLAYFFVYAWSYFYGDLYTQHLSFRIQSLLERMWLATMLIVLAAFQTYLFSSVIKCALYLNRLYAERLRRYAQYEECSERVRNAKENGLWLDTAWGGKIQQYIGEYEQQQKRKKRRKAAAKVQWKETLEEEKAATLPLVHNEVTIGRKRRPKETENVPESDQSPEEPGPSTASSIPATKKRERPEPEMRNQPNVSAATPVEKKSMPAESRRDVFRNARIQTDSQASRASSSTPSYSPTRKAVRPATALNSAQFQQPQQQPRESQKRTPSSSTLEGSISAATAQILTPPKRQTASSFMSGGGRTPMTRQTSLGAGSSAASSGLVLKKISITSAPNYNYHRQNSPPQKSHYSSGNFGQ